MIAGGYDVNSIKLDFEEVQASSFTRGTKLVGLINPNLFLCLVSF